MPMDKAASASVDVSRGWGVMTVANRRGPIQPVAAACCPPLAAAVLGPADADALSRQFAVLADPVRLRLLSLLATAAGGAVCACHLVEPAGRSQPTVSHHLKVLADAGLVSNERRGRNVWYAVVPAALHRLRAVLSPDQDG